MMKSCISTSPAYLLCFVLFIQINETQTIKEQLLEMKSIIKKLATQTEGGYIHDGGRYHIETSLLICKANQCTGFYMITTLAYYCDPRKHLWRNQFQPNFQAHFQQFYIDWLLCRCLVLLKTQVKTSNFQERFQFLYHYWL